MKGFLFFLGTCVLAAMHPILTIVVCIFWMWAIITATNQLIKEKKNKKSPPPINLPESPEPQVIEKIVEIPTIKYKYLPTDPKSLAIEELLTLLKTKTGQNYIAESEIPKPEPKAPIYMPKGSKVYNLKVSQEAKDELQRLNKLPRFESIDAGRLLWTNHYRTAFEESMKEVEALSGSGIYKITNKVNGKIYIGKSKEIKKRWSEHIRAGIGADLKDGKLYRDMYLLGPENFNYQVIDYCKEQLLNEREIYWIDFYNSFEDGYNSTRGNQKAVDCGQVSIG